MKTTNDGTTGNHETHERTRKTQTLTPDALSFARPGVGWFRKRLGGVAVKKALAFARAGDYVGNNYASRNR